MRSKQHAIACIAAARLAQADRKRVNICTLEIAVQIVISQEKLKVTFAEEF